MLINALADTLKVAIDVVLFLFGISALWHAGTIWFHQESLRKLGTTETGAVRDGGQVAVEGKIRGPVETDLLSPFRQQRGVVAKWIVKEFVGHEVASGRGWWEFGSGYETVPFLVDDGSGPVVVEIVGEEALRKLELELDESDDPALELDVTEEPPAHVREFLDGKDVRDRQSKTSVPTSDAGDEQGDRRYYETVLGSGDNVYVVGYASNRTDRSSPARVKLSPPPSEMDRSFYLSNRSREASLRRRLFRTAVTGSLGIFLVWYEIAKFVPDIPFLSF